MSNDDINRIIEGVRKSVIIQYKDLLTTKEAMEYTGLSEATLKQMRVNREIPYYKSRGGGKAYFKKSDLDEWMMGVRMASSQETDREATRMAYLK